MADRLKQIWAGFEETTDRHLTGKGVDNIVVPERVDYAAFDDAWLPENFEAPSDRAVGALQAQLTAKDKKRNILRKATAAATDTTPLEEVDTSFAEDALVAGLRATAIRTERRYADYETFLDTDAGKAALKKSKKKKRFGLF